MVYHDLLNRSHCYAGMHIKNAYKNPKCNKNITHNHSYQFLFCAVAAETSGCYLYNLPNNYIAWTFKYNVNKHICNTF